MNKDKVQQIFAAIEQYHMIEPGMRIVAGVSGGADSVCLLYVLCKYRECVPFELMAVHVEHGIRGEESLADAAYTKELCRQLDVPCRIVQVPVEQIAAERGLSVEEAGRMERYRIFSEVCREWKCEQSVSEVCREWKRDQSLVEVGSKWDEEQSAWGKCGVQDVARIAVAHNQNDQAETVLWNLVRGSGLKGLGGIRPVRGNIIRPLLFTDRKEIEQILTEAGLEWRTDRTNLTEDYTRNKIRLSILPQMEQGLNVQAAEHIAQAAGKLQQVQEFLERMTAREASRCIRQDGETVVIALDAWQETDELIRMELLKRALELFKSGNGLKDIGSVHFDMLEKLAEMDCGKVCHLPGQICAVRENGIIRLRRQEMLAGKKERLIGKENCPAVIGIDAPADFEFHGWRVKTELLANNSLIQKQILEENKYTKWLDYDIMKSNVLLRTRQSGDYLIVGAKGGRKKLKDFFIDLKIPRDQRDQILLLADGSHILWVVGYRISEAAKVKSETKQVLKIQMEESV